MSVGNWFFSPRNFEIVWFMPLGFPLNSFRKSRRKYFLSINSNLTFSLHSRKSSFFRCCCSFFFYIFLQHQVLHLPMSEGTAWAPQVFLFSGTKFHPSIKMVSYCITRLPTTECTIVVPHKQWLWLHRQLKWHWPVFIKALSTRYLCLRLPAKDEDLPPLSPSIQVTRASFPHLYWISREKRE